MLIRVLVAALAVVAAVVGVRGLHADHRCARARADAQAVPRAQLGDVAREAADRCADPRDRGLVALIIFGRGGRAPAVALARAMTTSAPDDYLGWLAVYRFTRDEHALRRAHALNPRGTPAPR